MAYVYRHGFMDCMTYVYTLLPYLIRNLLVVLVVVVVVVVAFVGVGFAPQLVPLRSSFRPSGRAEARVVVVELLRGGTYETGTYSR